MRNERVTCSYALYHTYKFSHADMFGDLKSLQGYCLSERDKHSRAHPAPDLRSRLIVIDQELNICQSLLHNGEIQAAQQHLKRIRIDQIGNTYALAQSISLEASRLTCRYDELQKKILLVRSFK